MTLIAISLVTSSHVRAQGTADYRLVQIPDDISPPRTLREMLEQAEVVALVKVQRSIQRAIPAGFKGESVWPLIEHDAIVLEIFKAPSVLKAQDHIKVSQFGGTAVSKGVVYVVDTKQFEILKPGSQSILFLADYPAAGTYSVLYGASGALGYDPTRGEVEIPLRARRIAEFGSRPRLPFSDVLRALRSLKVSGSRN